MNTVYIQTPKFFKQRLRWQRHSFSHSSSRSLYGQFLPVSAIHFECIRKSCPPAHAASDRLPTTAVSPKPPSSASGVPSWVLVPQPFTVRSPCQLHHIGPAEGPRSFMPHLPGDSAREAHVPRPVCPGQMLMPRHPASPAQLHCTAAAFPTCPSSDPRAFAPAVHSWLQAGHRPIPS